MGPFESLRGRELVYGTLVVYVVYSLRARSPKRIGLWKRQWYAKSRISVRSTATAQRCSSKSLPGPTEALRFCFVLVRGDGSFKGTVAQS